MLLLLDVGLAQGADPKALQVEPSAQRSADAGEKIRTALDPRDFGGRFDDPKAAQRNDEAIARMDAKATNNGPNLWDFSGGRWFYVTKPIRNPMRNGFGTGDNRATPRPLHWTITGRGVGGIRSTGAGYALEVRDSYAINYPPENLAQITIEDLRLSGVDGGLSLYGGGKTFYLENIQIVNCESKNGLPALRGEALDGACFGGRVYVQQCGGEGVVLDECHHVDFSMLTVRNARGDAFVARDFASLTGSLYCENNYGYGLRLERGASSNLQVWCERNRVGLEPKGMSGLGAIQNLRRNVAGCVFAGKTGAEACLGWDDDDVSASLNEDLSDPSRWPRDEKLSWFPTAGGGTPMLRGPWDKTKARVEGQKVIFEPDAFNAPAGKSIEFDLAEPELHLAEGELWVLDLLVSLDAETAGEITAELDRGRQGPAIGMRMAPSEHWEQVEPGSLAQYPHLAGDTKLRSFWRVKKSGRGILRPMVYAGLGNPPSEGAWPARELRYQFAAVRVAKLERPNGAAPAPVVAPHHLADLNLDGKVDSLDVDRWGELMKAGDLTGDLNRDGRVTISDLGVISDAMQ